MILVEQRRIDMRDATIDKATFMHGFQHRLPLSAAQCKGRRTPGDGTLRFAIVIALGLTSLVALLLT